MKKLKFLTILLTILIMSCNQSNQTSQNSESNSEAMQKAKVVKKRINKLLPKIMESYGIDAWLILCREVGNDPMAAEIGGENVAGNTAIIFFNDGIAFRSLVLSPEAGAQAISDLKIHDKVIPLREDQSALIMAANFLLSKEMQKIAVNSSGTNAIADGLSYTQRKYLEDLFADQKDKLVSSTELVNDWLSAELPK